MATTNRDHYEVLGVPRGASEDEIKRAFRRRARELHPDVNPGDPAAEARFKELAQAYEVLSNPETRQLYDRFGHEGLRGRPAPDFGDLGSFQDIFDVFFGEVFGRGGGRRAAPGDDVLVRTQVSFVESALGVDREVEFRVVEACEVCEGTGARPGGRVETCSTCHGEGQVRQVARGPFGQFVRTQVCPSCAGEGRVALDPCERCSGRGRMRGRRQVEVAVPAGIADGQRIRLVGQGNAGDPGAPPGDLYVEVGVAPDDRFAREGLDVVTRAVVSVTDAMLGTTIAVPTIQGEERIDLRPGTQSGQEVVLRGRGFPAIQRRGRGDQRVIVEVRIPRVTDDEGREAVERLAGTLGPANDADDEDEGFFDRIRHAFR
jgi:molecular chaperone DnaJ